MSTRELWRFGGVGWKGLGHQLWNELREDRILGHAAQLSFYFILSLFPLLLVLTTVLGLFLDPGSTIRNAMEQYVERVAPETVSGLIQDTLQEVNQQATGGKLSIGLLVWIWAASSGMIAIISSLNMAYEIQERRAWWKQRLTAIILTLTVVLLLLSALLLLVYGPEIGAAIAKRIGLGSVFNIAWQILQWPVLLAFLLLAFNLIYVYAPNVKHREWHWLMPGTVVALALWLLASFGFKVYLMYFNRYSMTYGSIAGVIILMLWLYITGVAILIGGSVNSAIEKATRKVEQKE